MAAPQGVSIAFSDATLAADPTWTRLDTTNNLVASYSIDRGRSYELDKTGTGTAAVQFTDVHGILDATNTLGAYYTDIQPLKQAAIALKNPVTDAWSTLFRGFVEDFDYAVDKSRRLIRVDLSLVDMLEILAAAEMVPNPVLFGDTPPDESAGNVYYGTATHVDDRINQVLDDVGWASALRSIFSGNVNLKPGIYSPHTEALQAILDAADAEFPGVSNFFASREGLATFHGRLARFDPTNPDYGLNSWKCGDGTAVAASISDTAELADLQYNRGKDKIINSASALPSGIADGDIDGQLVQDATSIGLYGTRSWSAEGLLTDSGISDSRDDLAETFLFSAYHVNNYKLPQTRVSQVTFRSLPPADPRAPALWALICGVEISDQLAISTTHPGGGGFDEEPFFIEGIHYDVRPANPSYHDVTLTLDLSPQAYFSDPSGLDGT